MYHASDNGDRWLYPHHNSSDHSTEYDDWRDWHNSTEYKEWRDNNVRIAWAFLCLLFLILVMVAYASYVTHRDVQPTRELGTKSEFDKSVATMVSSRTRCEWVSSSMDAQLKLVQLAYFVCIAFEQTVQPHGQGKPCICGDSDPEDQTKGGTCCWPRLISRCRSKRAEKHAIRPATESASVMSKTRGQENSELQTCVQAVSDGDERLELAKEGSSVGGDGIICGICIDYFRVGEKVTCSRMERCRHVFHYECILPWAVLGHLDCPVCRATFWSQGRSESEPPIFSLCHGAMRWRAASEIRHSQFCVQHGLVSS